jgi:hypothetical protein
MAEALAPPKSGMAWPLAPAKVQPSARWLGPLLCDRSQLRRILFSRHRFNHPTPRCDDLPTSSFGARDLYRCQKTQRNPAVMTTFMEGPSRQVLSVQGNGTMITAPPLTPDDFRRQRRYPRQETSGLLRPQAAGDASIEQDA